MANFPKVGEMFEGRYRVDAVLGAGGFARVYRAWQTDVEREVAIKVMSPAIDDDGNTEEKRARLAVIEKRFGREAKLISRLKSPNTVVMYDYGRTADGLLFMTLEYVAGETMADLLDREAPLDPTRAVELLLQVLESLAEAHAINILHRDIKPENIMVFRHVDVRERVKVLDFGIAKVLHTKSDAGLSGDDALVGTPRFMSPEQIRGAELTPSSDLYSLGLVFYEMLTGVPAVAKAAAVPVMAVHLDPLPIEIPDHPPLDRTLRNVLSILIHKDNAKRPQTAEQVTNALVRWRDEVAPRTPSTQVAPPGRGVAPSDRPATELLGSDHAATILDQPPPTVIPPTKIVAGLAATRISPGTESDEVLDHMALGGSDRLAFDPNLDEEFEPEFLRQHSAEASEEPRRGSRAAGMRSVPKFEEAKIELDRSAMAPQRTAPVTAAREPAASMPRVDEESAPTDWRKVAGIVICVVVFVVVWRQMVDGPDSPKPAAPEVTPPVATIEPEVAKVVAPPSQATPQRYSTKGILRALQNDGWAHTKTAARKTLDNVHEEGFKITRGEATIDLRIVTTTSDEAAQRMFDQTKPPVQPVVLDNKLVRVFPAPGGFHRDVGDVINAVRQYRDEAGAGVKLGR